MTRAIKITGVPFQPEGKGKNICMVEVDIAVVVCVPCIVNTVFADTVLNYRQVGIYPSKRHRQVV